MPYITPDIREDLDSGRIAPATPGSLNYVITKMVDDYVGTHGLSYATINDVIGVFECAKAEFYRRVAVPYENRKWAISGDVYEKSGALLGGTEA